MFQDTILHLFHSIVIVVQYLLGALNAEVVFGVFVPRQAHHCLQIGELYAVIGTLRIKRIELIQLLIEDLAHLFRPLLILRFLFQLAVFGRAFAVAQFLLDVLDLLLQEIFALLFVDVFARFGANVLLDLQQLHFFIEGAQSDVDTFERVVGLQHTHFIVQIEGHVRADEIGSDDIVVDIGDGKLCLVGHFLILFNELDGLVAQIFHGSGVFAATGIGKSLGSLRHECSEERLSFDNVFQLASA